MSAFEGCTALTSIVFPDTLLEIGEYAFRNCSSLSGVTFTNSGTVYRANTFEGCAYIPSVSPDGFVPISATMYTVSDATVRPAPSLDNEPVEWLAKGTAVTVSGINADDGWAKIVLEGETLYIRLSLLSYSDGNTEET